MENASKALLIGAGVLMAMIVISVLIVTLNNITNIEMASQEKKEAEEIKEFNEAFLSYNKSAMYGTDLISVLNLAIDNNQRYNASFGEEYYVNVSFSIQDNLEDITYQYTLNPRDGTYKKQEKSKITKIYGGRTYSIKNDLSLIQTNILSQLTRKEAETTITRQTGGVIYEYTIRETEILDLKRKTFRCKNVDTLQNGRVISMEFEQIKN